MSIESLFATAREHFVKQLTTFFEQERLKHPDGASEIKLELGEGCSVYQRLYCVDFVTGVNDGKVVELVPEHYLTFEPIRQRIGNTEVVVTGLQWDAVELRYEINPSVVLDLSDWFDKWFDLDGTLYDPEADLANSIHSLSRDVGLISLDCGTAPAEALVELIIFLERIGATRMQINNEREEWGWTDFAQAAD